MSGRIAASGAGLAVVFLIGCSATSRHKTLTLFFDGVPPQGEVEPTLLVPEEALVPERGKAYVFVVTGNVVERREVRAGKRRPGFVEIVSGVAEHEHVVVDGTQNVRQGSLVQEVTPNGGS